MTAAFDEFAAAVTGGLDHPMWMEISGDWVAQKVHAFDDTDWAALEAGWAAQTGPWQEAMAEVLGRVGSARAVDLLCAMILQERHPRARVYGIDGLRELDAKAVLAGRDDVVAAVREIDKGSRELGSLAAGALLALLR